MVLALDGEGRDAVVDDQRRRHVVLGAERVRAAEVHLGAARLERAHQVRGLGGDVQAGRDAQALERLLAVEAGADGAQDRHVALGPLDARAALAGQIQVAHVAGHHGLVHGRGALDGQWHGFSSGGRSGKGRRKVARRIVPEPRAGAQAKTCAVTTAVSMRYAFAHETDHAGARRTRCTPGSRSARPTRAARSPTWSSGRCGSVSRHWPSSRRGRVALPSYELGPFLVDPARRETFGALVSRPGEPEER